MGQMPGSCQKKAKKFSIRQTAPLDVSISHIFENAQRANSAYFNLLADLH